MPRITTLVFTLAILFTPAARAEPAAQSTAGQIFKSATCDCCSKWMAHMVQNGFTLDAKDMATKDLQRLKGHLGLKLDQTSCHTAMIGGYVIEGHVPAADVKRLLAEKPFAVGLSVPGMPVGTPGMEVGDQKVPYDVLLIKKDGTTEVFAKH